MSSVFTAAPSPVPARIGPKVFADVPSAKELEDAKRAMEDVKRARNGAMLWVILLAGALVAAGVFIALLLSRAPPAPPPGEDTSPLHAQIAQQETTINTLRGNLTALQEKSQRFDGISEAEDTFKSTSIEIGKIVADKPTYGDIKKRTIQAKKTPTTEQWVIYEKGLEKGGPVWKGEDVAQVKASVEQQARDVQALMTQIKAIGPLQKPGPNPGTGPCVGPGCQ